MQALNAVAVVCAGILLVTWVAYPAIIGALGSIRRVPRKARWDAYPAVSILLASREPPVAIAERVENCLAGTYPGSLEVIVALDSGDEPLPHLQGLSAACRIVSADPPGGKAAALNAGMAAATGEVVVFADTYQFFAPDAVRNLVDALAQPGVGSATGCLELPAGAGTLVSRYWRYERWLRRAEGRVHSSVGGTGAILAIKREFWRPLPPGLILDDVYTPMQIVMRGFRVSVAEDARAVETRTPTPQQEYARKVRTLTGVLQLCAICPRVLSPLHDPIWAQFVAHKLLRLLTPYASLGLGTWALVRFVLLLGQLAIPAFLVAAACGVWAGRARGATGTRLRRLISEAVLLQAAAVRATVNGARGRWQVWNV